MLLYYIMSIKPSPVNAARANPKRVSWNPIQRSASNPLPTDQPLPLTVDQIEEHHNQFPKGKNQYRPLYNNGKPVIVDGKYVAESIHGPSSSVFRDPDDNAITWTTTDEKKATIRNASSVVEDEYNVGFVPRPSGNISKEQQLSIWEKSMLQDAETDDDGEETETDDDDDDGEEQTAEEVKDIINRLTAEMVESTNNDAKTELEIQIEEYKDQLKRMESKLGGVKNNRKTQSKRNAKRKTQSKRNAKRKTQSNRKTNRKTQSKKNAKKNTKKNRKTKSKRKTKMKNKKE